MLELAVGPLTCCTKRYQAGETPAKSPFLFEQVATIGNFGEIDSIPSYQFVSDVAEDNWQVLIVACNIEAG
jgi:hypothetical protein